MKAMTEGERQMELFKAMPVVAEEEFDVFMEEICGGDKELFEELLNDYLDESQNLIEEAITQKEKGDWKSFNRNVHSLKSSSRTFGGKQLAEMCALLESLSEQVPEDSGEKSSIEAVFHELPSCFQELCKQLKVRLEKIS